MESEFRLKNENPKWDEWAKFLISEVTQLRKKVDDLTETVSKLRADIAVLKFKSGAWGIIGGSVPLLVGVLIYLVKETLK